MELGKNFYKIKENLYLKENKVISYETVVAEIQGSKLVEYGRYSRSTSKHVSFVASLLKLELVPGKNKMKGFYKHEMGVKCSYNAAISIKASLQIIERIKEGASYEVAIAMLKSSISKKDWGMLKGKEKISKELSQGAGLLNRLKP
jgi:hypothetical protein